MSKSYIVKIFGSNASPAYANFKNERINERFEASGSYCPMSVVQYCKSYSFNEDCGEFVEARFATREQANAAAAACHWNNQRYEVFLRRRPANVPEFNPEVEMNSCQDYYGR